MEIESYSKQRFFNEICETLKTFFKFDFNTNPENFSCLENFLRSAAKENLECDSIINFQKPVDKLYNESTLINTTADYSKEIGSRNNIKNRNIISTNDNEIKPENSFDKSKIEIDNYVYSFSFSEENINHLHQFQNDQISNEITNPSVAVSIPPNNFTNLRFHQNLESSMKISKLDEFITPEFIDFSDLRLNMKFDSTEKSTFNNYELTDNNLWDHKRSRTSFEEPENLAFNRYSKNNQTEANWCQLNQNIYQSISHENSSNNSEC